MKLSAAESALLSARERDMLQSKGPWNVKDLVNLIKRVRDLRDKQRQLTQRQKIASARSTGSKTGASGTANARTAQKGRVFDRALTHFEGQLDKLNKESTAAAASLDVGNVGTRSSKVAKKAVKKTAKRAAGKAATKSAKKSPAKKSPAKKSGGKAAKAPARKTAAKASKKVARKVTKKATKKDTKKDTKKSAPAKGTKSSTAKTSRSAAKSSAGKTRAKKAATKKAASKKAPATKVAKNPGKPARKAVSKKVAARKVAKAAEARKHAGPKGPVQEISAKARVSLPLGSGGHVDSQVASLPSQKSRAKRGR